MPDDANLPTALGFEPPALPMRGMPMAFAIMLDDRLFERAKMIAKYLSEAEGFVPPHLMHKPQACFAVVTRALTWRLDPYAVACSTYQTPGGRVGYEGKLVQAILENSGKIEGPVRYEHYGDWQKVKGKFQVRKSERGKDYAVPTWTREDAAGLGVIVRAQVKGEVDQRELRYDLDEAFPLNSTLWATKPWQQICYTACRAFANVCAPGLLMGVPFEGEDLHLGAEGALDVTPRRPRRADFEASENEAPPAAPAEPADDPYALVTADGEERTYVAPADAANALYAELKTAAKSGPDALEGVWGSNAALMSALRGRGEGTLADQVSQAYGELIDVADKAVHAARQNAAPNNPPPDGFASWATWGTEAVVNLSSCKSVGQLHNTIERIREARKGYRIWDAEKDRQLDDLIEAQRQEIAAAGHGSLPLGGGKKR